jgi:hypothetical protein
LIVLGQVECYTGFNSSCRLRQMMMQFRKLKI